MIWFWINTTFACGAIMTDEQGVVKDACPIYKKRLKCVGKPLNDVLTALRAKSQLRQWVRL